MSVAHVSTCPHIGPVCAERDEPGQIDIQSILVSELRLSAEYSVLDGWALQTVFPLRFIHDEVRVTDLEGNPYVPDYEDIHHRSETLFGVSDPLLFAHHARSVGPVGIDLRAGVSIPLGRTEENPFLLELEGRRHQHFQFGSGTFGPVVGAEIRYARPAWSLVGWGLAILYVYGNDEGYEAPDRWAGGLRGEAPLGLERWTFHLGGEVQKEGPETWEGTRFLTEGNLGRTEVLVTGGARWRFAERWSVSSTLMVPLYRKILGAQLSAPFVAELGLHWVTDLGGGGDGHDHGAGSHAGHHHEEGRNVDWTGLDRIDVAPDGEDVDLVPVEGKVTVFDFWATWCEPCKELDSRLAELARRHPDRIAVRRLRVETWETPAARRYLAEAPALPHVVVYGADGRRAFARGGAPAEIAAAIEALLP